MEKKWGFYLDRYHTARAPGRWNETKSIIKIYAQTVLENHSLCVLTVVVDRLTRYKFKRAPRRRHTTVRNYSWILRGGRQIIITFGEESLIFGSTTCEIALFFETTMFAAACVAGSIWISPSPTITIACFIELGSPTFDRTVDGYIIKREWFNRKDGNENKKEKERQGALKRMTRRVPKLRVLTAIEWSNIYQVWRWENLYNEKEWWEVSRGNRGS